MVRGEQHKLCKTVCFAMAAEGYLSLLQGPADDDDGGGLGVENGAEVRGLHHKAAGFNAASIAFASPVQVVKFGFVYYSCRPAADLGSSL